MGNILNISNLLSSNTKELNYSKLEKELLNRIIIKEKEDILGYFELASKEDCIYLKKSSEALSKIIDKVDNGENHFSFIEYDYMLGAIMQNIKRNTWILNDEEMAGLKDLMFNLSLIYKSFKQ